MTSFGPVSDLERHRRTWLAIAFLVATYLLPLLLPPFADAGSFDGRFLAGVPKGGGAMPCTVPAAMSNVQGLMEPRLSASWLPMECWG